jgi:hypothetical protein
VLIDTQDLDIVQDDLTAIIEEPQSTLPTDEGATSRALIRGSPSFEADPEWHRSKDDNKID